MFINFFKTSTRTMLGRWNNNITNKQKDINCILSNLDHCGDHICGHPKPIKDIFASTNKYSKSFTSRYLVDYKLK